MEDAHAFIAREYLGRNEVIAGANYVKQSLEIKPTPENIMLLYYIKDQQGEIYYQIIILNCILIHS